MDLITTTPSKRKIYSVSELNREAKALLSEHFYVIQIEGELSNLSKPSSGHIYFSLKDSKAQVRCAMFKSQCRRLTFEPQNGDHVIISAQVSLYEARGDYQLIADKMQQAGTGNLQLAFEQLKNKLLKEGLFEANLKKPIPLIPEKIAIITSATGAAVHDILSVLKRRFPSIPVVIYPTAVQGATAKFEIVKALETANQQKQADLIILARGGGSLEDLWAFNEECVARAIVKSTLPVISAIGHEVDFTIADFVADLRAPTPSVAAEHAVPNQQVWIDQFQSLESRFQHQIRQKISQSQQSINWFKKSLTQQHPSQKIQHHAQALDRLELRLKHAIHSVIKQNQALITNREMLFNQHSPTNRIVRYQQQQEYLQKRLDATIRTKIDSARKKYLAIVHTLNTVSPLATLERGYAIVSETDSSTIINSTQQLVLNQTIKTRLADGSIISQIKEIQHD